MSEINTVLVLGTDAEEQLMETLFECGLVPIVRTEMMEALSKLRHESFAAILVDRDHIDADALEFTLNVRDMNDDIPIIVVGESDAASEDTALEQQNNILIIGNRRTRLRSKIKQII